MDKDLKKVLKEIKELNKGAKKNEKNKHDWSEKPVNVVQNVGIGIGMGTELSDQNGGFISDFRKGLADGVNNNVEYSENKKEEKDIDDLSR